VEIWFCQKGLQPLPTQLISRAVLLTHGAGNDHPLLVGPQSLGPILLLLIAHSFHQRLMGLVGWSAIGSANGVEFLLHHLQHQQTAYAGNLLICQILGL